MAAGLSKADARPPRRIPQALLVQLQTIPAATVLRGAVLPERIPAGGLLILRDGDAGAPEVLLSRLLRAVPVSTIASASAVLAEPTLKGAGTSQNRGGSRCQFECWLSSVRRSKP